MCSCGRPQTQTFNGRKLTLQPSRFDIDNYGLTSHSAERLCCSICGSKRQRNLITKKHLFLKSGSVEYETRCKRCWDAFEALGNGRDRVHLEGSNPTGKPAYRYSDMNQAQRVRVKHG